MRVRRRRESNKLTQPVLTTKKPAATDPLGLRDPQAVRLPRESVQAFHTHKQQIENSLGVIIQFIPELKQDVHDAMDVLFRGVTPFFAETAVGEPWEILQREWLNVLRNIDAIMALLPASASYGPLRKNLRVFRDHLRATVGRAIVHKPSGTRKDQAPGFSTQ